MKVCFNVFLLLIFFKGFCIADVFFMSDGSVVKGIIVSYKDGKFTVKSKGKNMDLFSDKIDKIVPGDEFSSQEKVLNMWWEAAKRRDVQTMKDCISQESIKNYENICGEPIDEYIKNIFASVSDKLVEMPFIKEGNKNKIGFSEDFLAKRIEGETKGNLGTLRSTLNIFYSDCDGVYPRFDLSRVLVPKYIKMIPNCEISGHHKKTNEVVIILNSENKELKDFIKDTGKWLYMADPQNSSWGDIMIDCTHTDKNGQKWSEY